MDKGDSQGSQDMSGSVDRDADTCEAELYVPLDLETRIKVEKMKRWWYW